MANEEALNILLKWRGSQEFRSDAKSSAAAVGGIGDKAQKSGRQAAAADKKMSGARKGFKLLGSSAAKGAAAVAGLGLGLLSISKAKQAVNTTVDLAKGTLSLNKGLGLSVERASEWAAIAKARGVDTKGLNMAFGALARNSSAASTSYDAQRKKLDALGTSTADQKKRSDILGSSVGTQADMFKKLGISGQDLASSDFDGLLTKAADGFAQMKPGAERTAVAMGLFGRGWQTIVPLLRSGSKEMNGQLDLAKKYGATFSGGTVKSMNDLIKAQREAEIASLGLQVTFGTQMAPALTKGITAVSTFFREMREGKGEAGQIGKIISQLAVEGEHFLHVMVPTTSKVIDFVEQHKGLQTMVAIVGSLVVTWKALKFGAQITGLSHVIELGKKLGETKAGASLVSKVMGPVGTLPGRIRGSLGGRLRSLASRLFGAAGTAGGTSFASRAASTAGSTMPTTFGRQRGRWRAAGTSTGKTLGSAAGTKAATTTGAKLTASAGKGGALALAASGVGGALGTAMVVALAPQLIQGIGDALKQATAGAGLSGGFSDYRSGKGSTFKTFRRDGTVNPPPGTAGNEGGAYKTDPQKNAKQLRRMKRLMHDDAFVQPRSSPLRQGVTAMRASSATHRPIAIPDRGPVNVGSVIANAAGAEGGDVHVYIDGKAVDREFVKRVDRKHRRR